ncbi:VOC family protein [Polyangium mundeleinium]|uniref:VOC family protein n=1 Tax=Polyangium mundeleinium TaxID=2995306 RepID=A0ABT5EJP4_9BACT|nr:VOC family protein [Polyangium mundeleinium]MDC0742052.1 VOC family protein [Polyangium mundeleinium]
MSDVEKGPFAGRIQGIDHLTLPVGDLAVAERFYVGLLGAKVLMRVTPELLASLGRSGDVARSIHITVELGSARIDLFPQGHGWPSPTQDHPHIAFAVAPEDIVPMKQALEANGVATEGPRRLGPPGHASLYFYDPFGNHLELTCRGFTGDLPIGAPDLHELARRAGRA